MSLARFCARKSIQRRIITPGTGELSQVNIELGLAEATTIDKTAGGVIDALKFSLGDNVLLDLLLEGSVIISRSELLDDSLEDKGAITSPGIPVYFASLLATVADT